MQRIRMAVIGVGALGQHHARILSQQPDVELVAVADANAAQGTRVAARCGCRFVPDWTALTDRVDAVVIAVPTSLHAAIACRFLASGVATLVEKPLAGSVSEAERIVAAAREHGVPLQVGHIERFNPAAEVLGRLADPRHVLVRRCSPFPFRCLDVSVVADVMIHDLDLLLTLTGQWPNTVSATGLAFTGEQLDVAHAHLEFPGGLKADVLASRVDDRPTRTWELWTAGGRWRIDFQQRRVESWCPTAVLAGDRPLARIAANRTPDELRVLRDRFVGTY
ncbi:MAG: gfo/Idh/MocA family oxidoreductase, partial [Planctomycetota bacterium]